MPLVNMLRYDGSWSPWVAGARWCVQAYVTIEIDTATEDHVEGYIRFGYKTEGLNDYLASIATYKTPYGTYNIPINAAPNGTIYSEMQHSFSGTWDQVLNLTCSHSYTGGSGTTYSTSLTKQVHLIPPVARSMEELNLRVNGVQITSDTDLNFIQVDSLDTPVEISANLFNFGSNVTPRLYYCPECGASDNIAGTSFAYGSGSDPAIQEASVTVTPRSLITHAIDTVVASAGEILGNLPVNNISKINYYNVLLANGYTRTWSVYGRAPERDMFSKYGDADKLYACIILVSFEQQTGYGSTSAGYQYFSIRNKISGQPSVALVYGPFATFYDEDGLPHLGQLLIMDGGYEGAPYYFFNNGHVTKYNETGNPVQIS